MTHDLPTLTQLAAMSQEETQAAATLHGFSFRSPTDEETPSQYRDTRSAAARSHLETLRTTQLAGREMTPQDMLLTIDHLKAELAMIKDAEFAGQQKLAAERAQWEAFKVTAGQIGMRYARENSWCQTARKALEEMGIPVPSVREKVEVVVKMVVELENVSDSDTDPSFVESSATVNFRDGTFTWCLDSDFRNVNIVDCDVTYGEAEYIED